jgi:hypothetical protein
LESGGAGERRQMAFDFVFGSAVLVGYFSYLIYGLIRGLMHHDLKVRRIHTRL